jgi:2-polyprenyl-3-methyl-5-hydroxy-6-metoxy-1,4-benzoquinol methylase
VIFERFETALRQQIDAIRLNNPQSGHHYHLQRYLYTFAFLPEVPTSAQKPKLLDIGGAYGVFADALKSIGLYQLTVGDVVDSEQVIKFDCERDVYPFENDSFDVVLFTEVLEHLTEDPMFALTEINRVLKIGGQILLTTPNLSSWKAINRALKHENPYLFSIYVRTGGTDRHNREYTYNEVVKLIEAAGFEIERAEAIDVYDHDLGAVPIVGYDQENRGDTTFCLARKIGPVRDRKPNWLYWP